MNSLYYSSKKGCKILQELIEELKKLKCEIDLELYRKVLEEIIPQRIEIVSVVRRAGVSSVVFCKTEKDLKLLVCYKKQIEKIFQDSYSMFFIWNEECRENIEQVISYLTLKKARVNGVKIDEKRKEINVEVITSKGIKYHKINQVKVILDYVYDKKVQIKEVS